MIAEIFTEIGAGITGLLSALGDTFGGVVALFYDATATPKITFLGSLLLLGVASGLVWGAFALVKSLIARKK